MVETARRSRYTASGVTVKTFEATLSATYIPFGVQPADAEIAAAQEGEVAVAGND